MMRKIERENTGLLHAGQDLVVAGYAGLAGTVKLAEAKEEDGRDCRLQPVSFAGRKWFLA